MKLKVLIILCFFNLNLYSADPIEISLKKFIEDTKKSNPVFQQILTDELGLAFQKDLKLPVKDLILNVNSEYNLNLNQADDSYPSTTIGLSKLFPYTGTTLAGQYRFSFNTIRNSQTSSLLLTIAQPLLKNSFGYANRLKEDIADLDIEIARYQILESYENYYAILIDLYYNWYSAYINLENKQIDYNDTQRIQLNIQNKFSQSIADKTDLNKIQLQVYDKIDNLITASNTYQDYSGKIKQALMLKNNDQLIPIKPDIMHEQKSDFEKLYVDYTNTSRTYRIMSKLEKKNIYDIKILKNNRLPELNLVGGYRMDTVGLAKQKEQNYVFAGINFQFPITGIKEKAQLEISRIKYNKLLLTKKNDALQYYTQLKNIYRLIEKEKRLIKNSEKKIKLAKEIWDAENKNYQYGRITLNQLLAAVTDYERKKLSKILQEVNLYKLNIEWMKLTDHLIEKTSLKKEE